MCVFVQRESVCVCVIPQPLKAELSETDRYGPDKKKHHTLD